MNFKLTKFKKKKNTDVKMVLYYVYSLYKKYWNVMKTI